MSVGIVKRITSEKTEGRMRYSGLLFFATVLCALATPCRAQTGTDWKLDDPQHVTATFPSANPTSITFDVDGVDNILQNLGRFRADMSPEISRGLAEGTVVFPVVDPIWQTQMDPKTGNIVLSIRDPRYGWLSYAIPRESGRKLGFSLLQSQAPAAPVSPRP
jgi:hypothetical protein